MDRLVVSNNAHTQIEQVIQDLPQALIIAGPRGSGTASVARYIARAVGSPKLVITPKKKLQGGTKSVEDIENGSIIIDDIRQLYEQMRSKFSSPQVVVIDFADRTMTTQAQNAFLKLLEEPQPNVHFILATHRPELLLPTITSRSQRIDLTPISKMQTEQLVESLGITDATRRARILFVANGLPAEVCRLAQDDDYYEARVKIVQDAKALLGGSAYQKMLLIHTYKDQRVKSTELINDMIMQLKLAFIHSPDQRIITQIDSLIDTYDRIIANGNIQLQLARVLL
jgi:DNA polymerase III subunit delta'